MKTKKRNRQILEVGYAYRLITFPHNPVYTCYGRKNVRIEILPAENHEDHVKIVGKFCFFDPDYVGFRHGSINIPKEYLNDWEKYLLYLSMKG
jgi:hypothetical protein